MKISVLERILVAERLRQKASFAAPIANRRPSAMEDGPWFVTNTKGQVVLTHLQKDPATKDTFAMQGFFECPIEEEEPVVQQLYQTMWSTSKRLGWNNRCGSLVEAMARMPALGYEPKFLLVPYSELATICGEELTEEEAERLALVKGCVAEVNGVKILFSGGLLPGSAILTALPSVVGHYLRSYENLSIMMCRANRSIVLVGHDAVD